MKYVILLLFSSLVHANGWVENGQFRYDFGNDIVNQNMRFGKAMPKHHQNNPIQIQIDTPRYQPQQQNYFFQYQQRKRQNQQQRRCVGRYYCY